LQLLTKIVIKPELLVCIGVLAFGIRNTGYVQGNIGSILLFLTLITEFVNVFNHFLLSISVLLGVITWSV